MSQDASLKLTPAEIAKTFADPELSAKFPPVMTIKQAAELLQVPVESIRRWRSRGLLSTCSRRMGKGVRFVRDRLLLCVFNDGIGD
jgi:hypothetical protein